MIPCGTGALQQESRIRSSRNISNSRSRVCVIANTAKDSCVNCPHPRLLLLKALYSTACSPCTPNSYPTPPPYPRDTAESEGISHLIRASTTNYVIAGNVFFHGQAGNSVRTRTRRRRSMWREEEAPPTNSTRMLQPSSSGDRIQTANNYTNGEYGWINIFRAFSFPGLSLSLPLSPAANPHPQLSCPRQAAILHHLSWTEGRETKGDGKRLHHHQRISGMPRG